MARIGEYNQINIVLAPNIYNQEAILYCRGKGRVHENGNCRISTKDACAFKYLEKCGLRANFRGKKSHFFHIRKEGRYDILVPEKAKRVENLCSEIWQSQKCDRESLC